MSSTPTAKNRAPELLQDLERIVAENLRTILKLKDQSAFHVGRQVAVDLARQWGGQQLYVPKGAAWRISALHDQVFEAVNGNNHAEVAASFNISTPHVYRIVSEVRKARRKASTVEDAKGRMRLDLADHAQGLAPNVSGAGAEIQEARQEVEVTVVTAASQIDLF